MNYERLYTDIIKRGLSRGWSKGNSEDNYIEMHHIIPKCMGGSDIPTNIVALTGREHFLAHWLLYKIHKLPKLANAWHRMSSTQIKGCTYNSKSFTYARKAHSEAVKIQATGRTHSEESKYKIGIGNSGKVRSTEMNEANRLRNTGKKHSDVTKLKCKINSLGRIHSDASVEKIKLTKRSKLSKPVLRTSESGDTKLYEFLPMVADDGFSPEQVRRCCSDSYPGRITYMKYRWEYAGKD